MFDIFRFYFCFERLYQTIGVAVKETSGKEVDNVVSHIAQRTFDHSAPVRLMVTTIIGDWLLNLRDRYLLSDISYEWSLVSNRLSQKIV